MNQIAKNAISILIFLAVVVVIVLLVQKSKEPVPVVETPVVEVFTVPPTVEPTEPVVTE